MYNCIYLIKIFELDLAVHVGEIVFPFSLTRWGCQSYIYIIIIYVQATSIFFYSYGHYIDISLQSRADCTIRRMTHMDVINSYTYIYNNTIRSNSPHQRTRKKIYKNHPVIPLTPIRIQIYATGKKENEKQRNGQIKEAKNKNIEDYIEI